MAEEKTVVQPEAASVAQQPSKRDAFRGRMSQRYPDLNMDDEDAYYDQMGKAFDEYEGYENSSKRLRESMTKSPMMAEMLLAAREQDDFDPVVWMVQQKGLDLEAVQNDPEYAKKLSDAHAEYLEKRAKSDEIVSAMQENMPRSVEAIRTKAAEMGLSEEQTEEVVGQMYQTMDDMVHGILNPEIFALLAKGGTHDADVAQAHDEGMAEGLNQKVDDKLRTLETRKEHVGGSQTPIRRPEPNRKRERNMFMAYDEDED